MTSPYRKKLIEVALPLEDTCLRPARRQANRDLPAPRLRQAGAAREKSIRHGHSSGLHLWPAHGHARAGHAVGVLLTIVLFLAAGTALRQRLKASPFRIAYERYVNDNREIFVMLTTNGCSNKEPAWFWPRRQTGE